MVFQVVKTDFVAIPFLQSDLEPVGEQLRKFWWSAPKMRRCKSKWSDGFELSPLFMMDEKYYTGGGVYVTIT